MLTQLKKDIHKHLKIPAEIPYELKQEIQSLKEGTITNIQVNNNVIEIKKIHAFQTNKEKPKLHTKAIFNCKTIDNIGQYENDIIDISLSFPKRLTPHTKIEHIIEKHKQSFLKLFLAVELSNVSFQDVEGQELDQTSPEFHLTNQILYEFFEHILFPFHMFEIFGFYELYKNWFEESKTQLFVESNCDDTEKLSRYICENITEKKGHLFFGTDIHEIDEIIKYHKDIFKITHEAAKKENKYHEYTQSNIYTLKFWLQRFQKPSGFTSWREKLLYIFDK